MGHDFRETARHNISDEKFKEGYDRIDWNASKKKKRFELCDDCGGEMKGRYRNTAICVPCWKDETFKKLDEMEKSNG